MAEQKPWPPGLLERVKSAEQRIQDDRAPRSIPADPRDVDLVLAEVRMLIEGTWPPFWLKENGGFKPGVIADDAGVGMVQPWNVDDLMQLVFRYGAARCDVDRSNSAANQRGCNEAIDAIRSYIGKLTAGVKACDEGQP